VTSLRRPPVSLLATLALATLAAACKDNGGPIPDGSAGAGGSGGRGGAGPDTGGSGGADAAGGSGGRDSGTPRDSAVADRALPDRPDAGRMDVAADRAADAATNPRQLWFAGPESDLHLDDIEPQVPF
jgi:hypothetical protein